MGVVGERHPGRPCVAAHPLERLTDVDAQPGRHRALRLLDGDAALEGRPQLLGEPCRPGRSPAPGSARSWRCRPGPAPPGPPRRRVVPGPLPKTLSAPITRSRSRIGKACTERNPTATARGAKSGHRSVAVVRSLSTTAAPLTKQSRQGPCSSWSCTSSSSLALSSGRADVVEPPVLVGEDQARLRAAADLGGAYGDRVDELDHVEVGDQAVGDLDEHVSQPAARDRGTSAGSCRPSCAVAASASPSSRHQLLGSTRLTRRPGRGRPRASRGRDARARITRSASSSVDAEDHHHDPLRLVHLGDVD